MSSRARFILACAAALAIVLPLGWMWQRSLLPPSYSVADMGYMDYGGGPKPVAHGMEHGMAGHDKSVSVRDLTVDPKRKADQTVRLVARQGKVKLASGRVVDGYSINGKTPGPTIQAIPGRLLEVRVKNEDVAEGISLHWHGVDLPNAEDGVAGVTQDAILPGQTHVYRFVPDEGTYWYHSHQISHEQVIGGLFGALVVDPNFLSLGYEGTEVIAIAHTYAGIRTLNDLDGVVTRYLTLPRQGANAARVRIINTDNGTLQAWANTAYKVAAIDGRELNRPAWVTGKRLAVPAGGRADLIVRVPEKGAARVQVGSATALVIRGHKGAEAPKPTQPAASLDLLSYGQPKKEAIASEKPDRTFQYSIGRRLGFLDGEPGFWWTVNGHLYPNIPMFTVREGDVVKFHIDNHSGESHPMHLHGHHALVVARDGKPVAGSPLWVDSIDVENNQTMDLVFRADNPGIWMDHCHNLTHAAEGLVAHLMYEGVTTPYVVGGKAGNEPE